VDKESRFRYGFAMAETAVVALLPELEPLIGAWRRHHTVDGARGMPPHVTLISPFADSSDVNELLEPLGRALTSFTPFAFELRETARFPGFLYLRPEPGQAFVAITEALAQAFRAFPPYAGEFADIVPHVTVAQGDEDVLATAERELRPQLPVRSRVERAWLVEDTPGGWRRRTAFPLERRKAV
jgi:2'-5' RNA ligase